MVAADVVARLRPWLDAEQSGWTPGYRYELGGEEETSVRANQSIAEQLPVEAAQGRFRPSERGRYSRASNVDATSMARPASNGDVAVSPRE